ncbi:hypothetical protein [Frigoribacterium sp. CFBP 8751]|uniref:hypothetical protein n=1 Tax=Frigoribacterium sp. CFBP 8751 TaxID=2775277 RepID=UPI00177B7888|nr:hypothetical protein [Frigoribacterium sp. CFBP 8751]MBD8538922.1 hypothetical protein [Frigoribacterium sp. CFBP 8751]
MRSAGESMGGGRGVWWFALLGVLVLVDVGLIVAAVSSTQPRAQAEAGPIPTFSQEPIKDVVTPPPSETPTPTASSSAAGSDSTPQVFLSAVSETEAWRATSGDCAGTPARVERTTDGGATWDAVTIPFDLRTVVALSAGSERTSVYGGVGDTCGLGYWSTFTAGEFWKEYPSDAIGVSYLDQATSTVVSATDVSPAPCDAPRRVLVQDTTTMVVCDGLLETSGSAGWTPLIVAGVMDATPAVPGYFLALRDAEGCDGIAVATVATPLSEGVEPTRVGCVSGADGTVAIAVTRVGDVIWLSSADRSWVSTDGGVTW